MDHFLPSRQWAPYVLEAPLNMPTLSMYSSEPVCPGYNQTTSSIAVITGNHKELGRVRQLLPFIWPGSLQVLGQVLRKNQRSPCWSQPRDQTAQERKRVSYSHLLLREEVMNVSATPATADQISHGGNSGTTRQPPRWRLTRRPAPRVLL